MMVLVRYLKNLTTQKSQLSLKGHQYTDTGRFKTGQRTLDTMILFVRCVIITELLMQLYLDPQ